MIRKYSFTTAELQTSLIDYLEKRGFLRDRCSNNLERAVLNFVIDNSSSKPEIRDFSIQIDDGELEAVETQD
jgi:hypothetical protein